MENVNNLQEPKMLNENMKGSKKSSRATIGFILGLCSIIAWILPLIGYPVTITGIVFSSMGMDSDKKGYAIAGLVLSIIFLILTLINSVAGAMMVLAMY